VLKAANDGWQGWLLWANQAAYSEVTLIDYTASYSQSN